MSTTQQNQGGRTGFFSRFSKLGGSASAAGTTGSGTGTAVPPSSIASSQQTKRTSTASDLLVGPTASAATQATVVAGGTNASGGPSPGAGAGKGVVSPMDLLLLPTPPTSPYSTTTVHLGSGTFGPVDLAVHTATNESFALKRLATGQPIEDPLERRMLMNELLFGQTLVHPAIIKSYEAVQDQSDRDPAATASGGSSVSRTYSERSYDTAGTAVDSRSDDGSRSRRGADGKAKPANEIRLAMEVCAGGGLLKHLLEKGTSGYGLGEVEARRMFRQLIGAVAYLHKRSIAHRDLKLDNLLLDTNNNIKLIDFGMATFFDPDRPLTEWMGSIWYEAPEIHLENPYRPDKIDVWALGIILYTLLVSQFPFSITDPRKAIHLITSSDLKLPSYCSPAAQRLFSRMCERDPAKRADIYEVLWDEWVNTGYPDLPYVGSAQDEKFLKMAGQSADKETEDTVDLMMRFCGHDPTVLDADLTNKYIEKKLRDLLTMSFQRNPAGVIRLPLFEDNVPVLVAFRRKQTASGAGRGLAKENLWNASRKAAATSSAAAAVASMAEKTPSPLTPASASASSPASAAAPSPASPQPPPQQQQQQPAQSTTGLPLITASLPEEGFSLDISLDAIAARASLAPTSTQPEPEPEKPADFNFDFELTPTSLDLASGLGASVASSSSPGSAKPPMSPATSTPVSGSSTPPSASRPSSMVTSAPPRTGSLPPSSQQPQNSVVQPTGSTVAPVPSESPSVSRKTLGNVLSGWRRTKK